MNRAAFYAHLRRANSGVFGSSLSQRQVETMEAILDLADARGIDAPSLAYILATAYHETGPRSRMMPNRENLFYTTAARIAAVWPTRPNARRFTRDPRGLANEVYNGRLGNRPGTDDGWTYRGGGLDHLTGRDNYRRASTVTGVDLVANPERITEPKIAAESLVDGLVTGRYRGHRLASYIKPGAVDFVGARAVVNADVRANGATVAGYARAFLAALEAGGREYYPATPERKPPIVSVETPAPRGFWAWLASIFGKR